MKKILLSSIITSFVILTFVISPSVTHASWWNPGTWFNNWSFSSNKIERVQDKNTVSLKAISIISPTINEILEPGKNELVSFSPIQNAVNYEVTITYPDHSKIIDSTNDRNPPVIILLYKTISTTTEYITIPQTKALYLSENSYNGEEILINALDINGKLIGYGKNQIKILPSPNQPKLLKANKYIIGALGEDVTLTFGALAKPYIKRTIDIDCVNSYTLASMDNKPCGKTLTLGTGTYIKKLSIKKNFFNDRETALSVNVRYYDSNGEEQNPSDITDESFVSFKLLKPTQAQASSAIKSQPMKSYIAQLQDEEMNTKKNCADNGLKFFKMYVSNNGVVNNISSNFAFSKIVGEPQYHYNSEMKACLISMTQTISPKSDRVFVSTIRDIADGKPIFYSTWDLDGKIKDIPNNYPKDQYDISVSEMMTK